MRLTFQFLFFLLPCLSYILIPNQVHNFVQQQSKTVLYQSRGRRPISNRDKTLSKMLQDMDFIRVQTPPTISLKDDPLLPLVENAVKAADSRKAVSISVFRVTHLTEVTQFIMVVEGNSKPQNQAISLSIEEDVLNEFQVKPSTQGTAASGWILMDYGSFIVHIMTPQMKNFYKLEKKWKDAEHLDITYLIEANSNQEVSNVVDDEFTSSDDWSDDSIYDDQDDDNFEDSYPTQPLTDVNESEVIRKVATKKVSNFILRRRQKSVSSDASETPFKPDEEDPFWQ